jgi:glycosyltransferase involved in cell wall biosynthesis
MKVLIITQKVDTEDSVLGFFHNWIAEFSKHFEKVSVICLEKGRYDLPKNVGVFSLGKESRRNKIKYVANFFRYILGLHADYDAVFVHMNQEYVLLGGFLWKILGKKIFMWRNHHSGSILTAIASLFCNKIFCTSKYSYTAKYKKTTLMPVGIDTNLFKEDASIIRKPNSVLFIGRISPVKKAHVLLEVLQNLDKKGIEFYAGFYGDYLPRDEAYYNSLKEKAEKNNLLSKISFGKGVPNRETVKIYNQYQITVNLSSSGMYDKTIFEAMACKSLVLASNENLRGLINDSFIFKQDDSSELEQKLEHLFSLGDDEKKRLGIILRDVVIEKHNLVKLGDELAKLMK